MPRYLSADWVLAFNDALTELNLTDAIADAGRQSITASDGTFAVAQVVTDAPAEVGPTPIRTVLSVDGGRLSLALDPDQTLPANVTVVLSYEDALAMAQGALAPADALAAGRVRVRGELAVLVAGQAVLAAATVALGPRLAELTDLN
ncbi:MAG TPA: SCP2 sterol-binding domain-containing protein [Acidimicrobiales bacterium]